MAKKVPEFDQSIEKMWNEIQQQGNFLKTFWGGSLAQLYLIRMQDLSDFSRILVFSLGLDGVQAFGNKQYEVWPVGLRLWNLHPEERGKKEFILLAALSPGPKAPQRLSPYLEPILSEINSSVNGLQTWNASKLEEEMLELEIATTQQDMPSLAKCCVHVGPSGRVNCSRCNRLSQNNPG